MDTNLNASGFSSLGDFLWYPFDGFPPFNPGEVNATVRDTSGGFKVGEIFCGGFNPGEIRRIEPDGSNSWTNGIDNNAWVVVTNEMSQNSYFQAFWVDRTGAWGGDLIAECNDGNVWRINSTGQASFVGSVPAPWIGGSFGVSGVALITIPNNVAKYGLWAGRILQADTYGEDGGSDNCETLDTNGFVAYYNIQYFQEIMGGVIQKNENLFEYDGNNYDGSNYLWSISASQFSGMTGDILGASGGSDSLGPIVLYRIHWNGSSFRYL